MPTDPAILAQLKKLWDEPVTETTAETDSEAAFVPFEWQPSPIPPAMIPPIRPADAPATWDAAMAELIEWFQSNRDRLPSAPFDLKPGGGVRVADPALWYLTLDTDIATGPDGPRGRLGTLEDDFKSLRRVTTCNQN